MPGPAFLSGETVDLRTFEEEDVSFVRDVVNDQRVWRSLGGQLTPTNLAMERRYFEEESRDDATIKFVVTSRHGGSHDGGADDDEAPDEGEGLDELDGPDVEDGPDEEADTDEEAETDGDAGDGGTRVGMVELNDVEWDRGRAEVAIWVAPDHQGAGYGRDALSTLVDYAFDGLGLHKLYAEAFAFNEASMGLLESVGFSREGRLREEEFVDGEWYDVIRYGLLAGERGDG